MIYICYNVYNLGKFVLDKIRHTDSHNNVVLPYLHEMPRIGRPKETEAQLVVAKA